MSNPFEDRKLRDWFISCCFAVEGELPDQVVTDGAGPFDEYEFDEFLQRQGMAILGIRGGASSDCLVLGRDGWDETEIDDFLEARRGSSLRVYSQEMMLAFLMTGTDPFEDPELCWAFGKGHPALEYLQEWGFEWPTTGIVPSWGDGDTGEPETWPQVGLLKHYGYKVGESGKPRSQRRKVLRQVFTARELHRVKSKEHMQEWGGAQFSEETAEDGQLHRIIRSQPHAEEERPNQGHLRLGRGSRMAPRGILPR